MSSGPVEFWVLTGDGFARRSDLVLTEHQFMEQHGQQRAFILRLGDAELTETA